MRELTEAGQRILSELEEVREYDLVHLINVITAASGSNDELDVLGNALQALMREGYIEVGMQKFFPRALELLDRGAATDLLRSLSKVLRYGQHGQYWLYIAIDIRKDKFPTVILTDVGLSKARDVLDKRGYRWWSPSRKR